MARPQDEDAMPDDFTPPDTALTRLRESVPLVHCITNYVAMDLAANVLLAAGGSPAMVHAEEEVADFAPIAGALTINTGTLSPPWLRAMEAAADAANGAGVPWVLDPVANFATPYRRDASQRLLQRKPAILRGNASEILALAGQSGAGKGADSGDTVEAAEDAARALARQTGAVVAVTGPVDFVTDDTRAARVAGGSDRMPKVTAMGCSQAGLMGGFAAVVPPLDAAVAALVLFAEAGTQGERASQGPGSFRVAFLDALAGITPEELSNAAHLTWL
ncbi:hydroxyethylthiazole kinase [Palleronia pelagia]